MYWKKKYEEEKEKNKKLDHEVDKLKKEIDRLTKTNSRYQIALFDHGNFKNPKEDSKRDKGGQIGHPDTNKEKREDYTSYKRHRIYAKTCVRCGGDLKRASATKQKILLDILINPQLVKLILESERQWCGSCKMEVNTRDPRTLPFTEYGINTFILVMVLRFKCHASFSNIAKVIAVSHELTLSKPDIANILTCAKRYLNSRYQKLTKAVRDGEMMYNDETGWLVKGQSAWMWIMAIEEATVYKAAESRGKGIMEEIYQKTTAYSMHDGLASYLKSVPEDKHLYCWAHFLRFCFEETVLEKKDSQAVSIRDKLASLYRLKKEHPDYSLKKLQLILTAELNKILKIKSQSSNIKAIQQRLRIQKDGLIKALIYTPDGTNNLAERELRPIVINKKLPFGSDTFAGMETTAILGSIIQTLSKTDGSLIPTLRQYIQEGVRQKH